MESDKGLILVWDLDQTLVGWYSDEKNNESWSPTEMKFRLNTRACAVLREAFLAKKAGIVSTIIMLTNNSHPEEAVAVIEEESDGEFDYIIARNDPLRNKTNAGVKDIATVSRILGYDVDPSKVWIIDDMRHKMVSEGAHWIQVVKQENNPFGSGFSENPDMTDYSPLQNLLNAYRRSGGRRNNTRYRKRLTKKKRQSKNKKRNRA
jgi:hypothetical protein